MSDTHGRRPGALAAVRMLESLEVDAVVHCGDIGDSAIIELFAPWTTHFVQGNCDEDPADLEAAAVAGGHVWHGLFGSFEAAGRRIALLHSHQRERLRQAILCGQWDLICYGHTHQAAIDRHGATLVVNPGALHRAQPHSLAIVDLPELEPQIIRL